MALSDILGWVGLGAASLIGVAIAQSPPLPSSSIPSSSIPSSSIPSASFPSASLQAPQSQSQSQSQSQPQSQPQQPETFTTGTPTSGVGIPRSLRMSIIYSKPEDLKVKQGDAVKKGDILVDRATERAMLQFQKKQIELSLAQIKARRIEEPPPLKPVPEVIPLPEANYQEQEALIEAKQLELQLAERTLQIQKNALNSQPINQTNQVEQAKTKVEILRGQLDNQEQKIVAIESLRDMPPSVLIHERKVLEEMQSQLEIAEADVRRAESVLQSEIFSQKNQAQNLEAAVEKAKSELDLAIGKHRAAIEQRKLLEYQHSLALARRVEEENQSKSIYARQLQEVEDRKRDKDFQLAQVTAKLQEIEEKLAAASVVEAPFDGMIRRVKIVGQTNSSMAAELILQTGQQSAQSQSSQPQSPQAQSAQPQLEPFTQLPSFPSNPSNPQSNQSQEPPNSPPSTFIIPQL